MFIKMLYYVSGVIVGSLLAWNKSGNDFPLLVLQLVISIAVMTGVIWVSNRGSNQTN